ncbi:MAG: diacylglycerol kinase family protein [Planctomycetota bacterium]
MADTRYVQIVVNPVSGRESSERLVSGLVKEMESAGWPVRVHRTTGPGDGGAGVAGCNADSCRALVVVGGDGTVREVATSVQAGVPIVILPRGTENLVAKYLGMATTVECVSRLLKEGVPIGIDIAEMRTRERLRRFLLVAGVGFDAEVVRLVHGARRGHITHRSYIWPILRTLWTYRHPRLRVETAEGVLFEGHGMVFVGNIPRYAIGLRLVQHADPCDGLLDVCVYECNSRLGLLRHAIMTLFRRHIGSRGVKYTQTRRASVSAQSTVDVEVDGDLADPLPAEFVMTDHKATFLVSAEWRA